MSNHLGELLKTRREALGLGRAEVARRLGYTNVSRGCRRLYHAEAGEGVGRDFLRRLTALLGIDPAVVRGLIDRDRREYVAAWEAWADEPVPMRAGVRLLPEVGGRLTIPDGVTTPDAAVAWAVGTATRIRKKVILAVSRRVTYTVHEDGRVDGPFVNAPGDPFSGFPGDAGKRFLFDLGGFGPDEPTPPDPPRQGA